MNNEHPDTIQQIIGQVRSLFYLVDEPTTTLTTRSMGRQLLPTPLARSPWTPRAAAWCDDLRDAAP
jgi:hypothetical protein